MVYESLGDYLSDFKKSPSLACVPVPIVAVHLRVSPASVTAMMRAGKLDTVKIGKQSLVAVDSLLRREDEQENEVSKVEAYLTTLAKKGVDHVFYEPVMNVVGLDWRVPAHRRRIGKILGDISERSMAEHKKQRLMLSVLVHRKTAGETKPGPGFFELAKIFEHDFSDEHLFVKKHTAKVLAAYGAQKGIKT